MKFSFRNTISSLLRVPRGLVYRVSLKFRRFGSTVNAVMGVLAFIAAIVTVVCLVVYVGFDSRAVNKHTIRGILLATQAVFLVGIAVDVLFLRRPRGVAGVVRVCADAAILLTLLPVLFPSASHVPGIGILFHRYFLYAALGFYAVAEICSGCMKLLGRRTNPSLILSASFIFFILAGSFVLMLPRCTVMPLSYVDSLFLASSAVSMTGLTPVDVSATFTPLGWTVLAVLMEIGALGVLTFTSFFSLFFSGRPSIYNQLLMRDFIYSKSMSALIPMLLYILAFTVSVEAVGAVGLYLTAPADMFPTVGGRAGFAAFHAIAAFTNSGLSTVPDGMANPALFGGGQVFYLVMTLMIFAGGIGFPNLVNFKDAAIHHLGMLRDRVLGRPARRRRVHVYDLNTKLVLVTTVTLFVVGAVAFFFLERSNSMSGMPLGKQIVQSLFYSATARSAGFAPINPASFLSLTLLILMFLMWVGGSSQSMAGGIKVNAFAAAMLNLRGLIRNHKGVSAFDRRISTDSIRRANGTIVLSFITITLVSGAMLWLEPQLPLKALIFETLSAVTTNGLSLGITTELSDASKILLSATMFLGRVGLLSVLLGLAKTSRDTSELYPVDEIIIS